LDNLRPIRARQSVREKNKKGEANRGKSRVFGVLHVRKKKPLAKKKKAKSVDWEAGQKRKGWRSK